MIDTQVFAGHRRLLFDVAYRMTGSRETYVGPWLPEPVLTAPDAGQETEMAESISMAMLVVLETLTPAERAIFLLHDVFGYNHAEIASILDKSEAAVRQTAARARAHVAARRRPATSPAGCSGSSPSHRRRTHGS
jgi:DNA-directed RNA polymerase specialized sigma24 family protein